jgi:hypothetical protein
MYQKSGTTSAWPRDREGVPPDPLPGGCLFGHLHHPGTDGGVPNVLFPGCWHCLFVDSPQLTPQSLRVFFITYASFFDTIERFVEPRVVNLCLFTSNG